MVMRPIHHKCFITGLFCCFIFLSGMTFAQFKNRYPLMNKNRNSMYFEAYELPVLNNGPLYVTAARDGKTLYFSARGWLWQFDLASGQAQQLTKEKYTDFMPVLSPDAQKIAFMRDDTRNMEIALLDLASGVCRTLVHSGAIDKEPAFSPDGQVVYYSSSKEGDMDIWAVNVASGERKRITSDRGNEMHPLPLPGGKSLVYVSKQGSQDSINLLNLETKEIKILKTGSIISQVFPALSPDGKLVAFNWPDESGLQYYQVWVMDLHQPDVLLRLTAKEKMAVTPAWNHDGSAVYFSAADERQNFLIKSVPLVGGEVKTIPVMAWNYQMPMGKLLLKTMNEQGDAMLAARISIYSMDGHPFFPENTMPRFDSGNGLHYFHSEGQCELLVPAGKVNIQAARGFAFQVTQTEAMVEKNQSTTVAALLKALWDPRQHHYYSGDNHFHINYGGVYAFTPADLAPIMRAEDIDMIFPMTANLHNRFMDQEWIGWAKTDLPAIQVSQEVRSHFLGHVGLLGSSEWFNPWFYGPGYPVLSDKDITNADALEFGRRHGGIGIYVHPVYGTSPFEENSFGLIPVNIIPDALEMAFDTLEITCLWSSEIGTAELWYRFLNLGLAIAPSAGSDSFVNYYRNMIFGTTRNYLYIEEPFTIEKYKVALKEGRGFVSTGPLIEFSVAGKRPGDVLTKEQGKTVAWSLELYSATAAERVEILVNGRVVRSETGLLQAGQKSLKGTVSLPKNGWIASRVIGKEKTWPVMHSAAFAHTAPIWLGRKGSTDKKAARAAATDLLHALDVAEKKVRATYVGAAIPRLLGRYQKARQTLERIVKKGY